MKTGREKLFIMQIHKDLSKTGNVDYSIFDPRSVLFGNKKSCSEQHKKWRWSRKNDPFLRCGRCPEGTQLIYCCFCNMKLCICCDKIKLPLVRDGFDPKATKYTHKWEEQVKKNLDHFEENKSKIFKMYPGKWVGYWLDEESKPQSIVKNFPESVNADCPPEAVVSYADPDKKFWISCEVQEKGEWVVYTIPLPPDNYYSYIKNEKDLEKKLKSSDIEQFEKRELTKYKTVLIKYKEKISKNPSFFEKYRGKFIAFWVKNEKTFVRTFETFRGMQNFIRPDSKSHHREYCVKTIPFQNEVRVKLGKILVLRGEMINDGGKEKKNNGEKKQKFDSIQSVEKEKSVKFLAGDMNSHHHYYLQHGFTLTINNVTLKAKLSGGKVSKKGLPQFTNLMLEDLLENEKDFTGGEKQGLFVIDSGAPYSVFGKKLLDLNEKWYDNKLKYKDSTIRFCLFCINRKKIIFFFN